MVQELRSLRARHIFPLVVAAISALAVALPQVPANAQTVSPGSSHVTSPQFEVAAIKPAKPGDGNHNWNDSTDQVSIENYTLRRLISVAYGLKSELQVIGGSRWVDTQPFDLVAKIEAADVANMRKMDNRARHQERNRMLQALLADRFGLKVSRAERKLPVYALMVTKSGAKVLLSKIQQSHSSELSTYNGRMIATNVSMDDLAHDLGIFDEVHDRVVVNRTGLSGTYDFKMNFTRDDGAGIPQDAKYPGLFTALKEQLGLELKPQKAPVEVIVVESATEPAFD